MRRITNIEGGTPENWELLDTVDEARLSSSMTTIYFGHHPKVSISGKSLQFMEPDGKYCNVALSQAVKVKCGQFPGYMAAIPTWLAKKMGKI